LTRENGTKRREAQAINRLGNEQKKEKVAGVNAASALLNLLLVPAPASQAS